MDSKKQSEIVEKYWNATSSASEENTLLWSDLTQLEESERQHFQQLKAFSKLSLGEAFTEDIVQQLEQETPVRRLIPAMVWRVAAILLLGLSFYYLYPPQPIPEKASAVLALEEDPERAYEVTKQALLLVSTKLNKAAAIGLPLEKFEETKNKIEKK